MKESLSLGLCEWFAHEYNIELGVKLNWPYGPPNTRRSRDWTGPQSPLRKATNAKPSASCARKYVTAPTTTRRPWNCPNAPRASSATTTG
jgi:hypothetical protein